MPDPSAAAYPRICACVLMNHPFPANLPLLRQLYRGRFTAMRFLVPFERMSDADVITVYRGSYNHAAYLTDAHEKLAAIDCDYYIVIHDDVLLNPQINERSFFQTFPLGPDDGFIAWADRTQEQIGRCVWHLGFVPKVLHPKSLLFGTGVEPETLAHYLPAPDALAESIAASGIPHTAATRLDPTAIGPEHYGHTGARWLLHGLSAAMPGDSDEERATEAQSTELGGLLVSAMLNAQRTRPDAELGEGRDVVPLPIPTVTGNYFTDFYILPKSGFDDFCHYVGVAGAANLFVEIMAPTMLFACCARVRTADELGIDFSGFAEQYCLRWFEDRRHVAIHPVKLSTFRRPENAQGLVKAMRAIGRGEPMPADTTVSGAAFGRWPGGFVGEGTGWHLGEHWGVWAADAEATFPVALSGEADVTLVLRAPLHGLRPEVTARLVYNGGGAMHEVRFGPEDGDTRVTVPGVVPDADGLARITLVSDPVVAIAELLPAAGDARRLGVGLVRIETVDYARARPAPALPAAETATAAA